MLDLTLTCSVKMERSLCDMLSGSVRRRDTPSLGTTLEEYLLRVTYSSLEAPLPSKQGDLTPSPVKDEHEAWNLTFVTETIHS